MQIINFLYEYFLIILVIMTVVILFLSGFIVTVAKKRIGDIVFEFDENTITRYKAKKDGVSIKYKGRSVGKKYTPRLYKKGLFTNRAYIIEQDAKTTTDIYNVVKGKEKEGLNPLDKLDDSVKEGILRSGILDRFLSVFKRIGWSLESFLMGMFFGTTIILIAVTVGWI